LENGLASLSKIIQRPIATKIRFKEALQESDTDCLEAPYLTTYGKSTLFQALQPSIDHEDHIAPYTRRGRKKTFLQTFSAKNRPHKGRKTTKKAERKGKRKRWNRKESDKEKFDGRPKTNPRSYPLVTSSFHIFFMLKQETSKKSPSDACASSTNPTKPPGPYEGLAGRPFGSPTHMFIC